jgi:hypothetical protein
MLCFFLLLTKKNALFFAPEEMMLEKKKKKSCYRRLRELFHLRKLFDAAEFVHWRR